MITRICFYRCYDCDDEVQPEKYKKVAECVEHIKKLACVPAIDTSQGQFVKKSLFSLILDTKYHNIQSKQNK